MTATDVFLAGLVHLCRLAGAGLLLYLAWELRGRRQFPLLLAAAAGALNLGLREAVSFAALYSETAAAPPLSSHPELAALDAATLAALLAWALSASGVPQPWFWLPLAAALPVFRPFYSPIAASAALAASAVLFLGPAARAQRHPTERLFFRGFAAACASSAAVLLLPLAPNLRDALFAAVSLALPLAFTFWMVRRNVFGLRPSRRFTFLAAVGLLSSLYLFVVQRVADELSISYGHSRSLVEVILIMAAAIFWMPLYEWMSRRMARRGQFLQDFTEKVIEQAASRLEPQEQIDFLAAGLQATLGCRRLLLLSRRRGIRQGAAGAASPLPPEDAATLLQGLENFWDPLIHSTSASPAHRDWLERTGFHYLLPLRHENSVAGALLLDVSPRRFLTDIDAMFPSMAREVSLLLVSTGLAEDKLEMEKALAAQEARAIIGDLTATIAHEIKNPLSNIRALCQLILEDESVVVTYARDLEFVISETRRLNASVVQLLEYAAQPAGEPVEVDLSALLRRAAASVEITAASAGLTVERDIQPDLLLPAADPRSVEQIVLNLVSNAVQASPRGASIRIAACRRNDVLLFSVRDQGAGVPPELREKIFQPYFTTRQSGTGLGLAIVVKNLRRLGGAIRLESPAAGGLGSEFSVTLPLERPR